MRKLFFLFLALVATTSLWAYDFQSGDLYYNITSETTVEVTYNQYGSSDNYSSLTTATIPESITHYGTTYSVTSIGDNAFSFCSSLTSIIISNSVTSIGGYAFSGCSLTSITCLGTTPPTLGTDVFYGTKLSAVYIPDNTLSAYQQTWGTKYAYVNNETTLTLHVATPGTLSDLIFDAGTRPVLVAKLTLTGTLNDADFTCMRETMTSLVDVDLSGITNTSGVNFNGKARLMRIILPTNLTSIGSSAFRDCSSLTSIIIPNSVTSIGDEAFLRCSSLTFITIPNSVTSIGGSAFEYCSSLTSVTIPNSVTSIGSSAFKDCSSLTSVTIGNSVTSIGYEAFVYCSSLSSITIPNSVTSIGSRAFTFCSSLTSITCLGTTPPTLGTEVFTDLLAVYIPENTLSAYQTAWGNEYVFVNNETTLTLHVATPGTLADLIFDAGTRPALVAKLTLTGTLNDADFTCMRETMTSLVDVDLSGITNTSGVNFRGKKNLLRIILPTNLTSIGNAAFAECSSLTSITIPNSVTSIGDHAFYQCESLTSVTIPNSVTSIGEYAFYWCTSLTSITIPNSITSIGIHAFSLCSSLTSITIPESVISIGGCAFYNCSSLTSIICLGTTPPDASDLHANTSTCKLIVPHSAYNAYIRHAYWGQFLNIVPSSEMESSAPDIYVNPANPAQKLLRNGQVYILKDDKTYTIMGAQIQ